ncbi:flagellar basal-body MS-ring/collar protein FliF [Lentibacillus sp. CBA3610]|uniref:flagellar basal-body MS-ring/collar protein FliF n=1 Tax=Lentibacillus sp. CBA3610 TaxID=2518176 RepID=UPI00159566A6|nr:flagellar basal-body MS-ring/collar protein FliF [Lentibacillus sp. CBA3610]QKY69029.1 flagellar basal body M-ring protein FliF [Lentibacillus sp. CBA3610]
MKNRIIEFKDTAKSFWTERSRSQKGIFIGSAAIVFALILTIILFSTGSKLVPLYNDLSVQEVSQIKEELDSRGVPYEVENGGTTIKVPESDVDSLLVDLAGQGIPNSGNIDYSFFSENASWGITDNEFDMIKLDAMQTELANLVKGVEGINEAEVMINMPEEPVFVSDATQEASASIVINTQPGFDFEGNQINALYHLVAKAVPDLNEENIAIMNQYFEYFDQDSPNGSNQENTYTYQQNVKKDIEKDIQQRLQQMLGAMVGMENVIVSVTADIDFTEENRVEELVEPVNLEDMEGLPVSIESIEETYEGNPPVGGEAGTGDEDIANYEGTEEGGDGEYELSQETINNEYNRIRKEIVESPYKIRDLGIQVAVDELKGEQDGEVQYLTAQEQETVTAGISSIMNSIISTSIDGDYDGEIQPEENTSIVFQEFSESVGSPQASTPVIPLWMYIAGGVLLAVIILLIILLLRNRKGEEIEEREVGNTVSVESEKEVPEIGYSGESESVTRKKQLEKMAKENPEDFAKLLRSWISND